jgi:hypothetical protein
MGKRPLIDAVSPLIILKKKKKKKKITSKMSPCPSLTVLSSSSKLPKHLLVWAFLPCSLKNVSPQNLRSSLPYLAPSSLTMFLSVGESSKNFEMKKIRTTHELRKFKKKKNEKSRKKIIVGLKRKKKNPPSSKGENKQNQDNDSEM